METTEVGLVLFGFVYSAVDLKPSSADFGMQHVNNEDVALLVPFGPVPVYYRSQPLAVRRKPEGKYGKSRVCSPPVASTTFFRSTFQTLRKPDAWIINWLARVGTIIAICGGSSSLPCRI